MRHAADRKWLALRQRLQISILVLRQAQNRWGGDYNIFSTWRFQTVYDWARAVALLTDYRDLSASTAWDEAVKRFREIEADGSWTVPVVTLE